MQMLLVGLYIGTGLLPLVLLKPVLKHRRQPGATGLMIAIVGTVLWGLANGAFLIATAEQAGYFIWNVRVAATSIAVVGWVLTVTEYVGVLTPDRQTIAGLFVIPGIGQLFAWTNGLHTLHYGPETVFRSVETVAANYGPIFYGNVAYLYGILAIGGALLLVDLFDRHRLHRLQGLALLGSILPPLALNGLHLTVLQQVDLTSVGLVLSMFVIGWALFYGQLLEVVPVARDRLVRDMTDPVVTLDTEGRVLDANPPARELCEVSGDYTGMPASEFLSRFSGVEEQIADSEDGEIEVAIDDGGDRRYFDVRQSTIRDPNDLPLGRLIVFREITERKRHAIELREKNRRLDEFASFVSHDLRNPLQIASGRAQLVRETGEIEHIDQVERSLARMETMISQLRTLTQADQDSLETRQLDLGATAESAWDQVETNDATLEIVEDVEILADRQLLMHVFENLFRNAIEHAQTGPESLTITVGDCPGGFYVADDGAGIPPDDRDDVLDYGYTTNPDGSGIGLAIVRTVTEAHGWSIVVTESETGGARFEFTDVVAGS